MNFTDDIYVVINDFLIKNDFNKANEKEKKELIDSSFKYYLSLKLKEIGLTDVSMETVNRLDIEELLNVLIMYLPEEVALRLSDENESKKDIVAPFILCLLKIMSVLQGRQISWIVDEEKTKFRKTFIKKEGSFLKSFNTHASANSLQAFTYLYKVFSERFIVIKTPHK